MIGVPAVPSPSPWARPARYQLLRISKISGQEHVERSAVLDLRGQGRRGLVGGLRVYTGLVLKLFQDRRKHRLEIGGRGHSERTLPRGRRQPSSHQQGDVQES